MGKFIYICLILLSFQCRERYEVPFSAPSTGFLVVEGTINYGGTTQIQLSRSSRLDSARMIPENSASVIVEGEDNSIMPLNEMDSGQYVFDNLPLNSSIKYRLKIITSSNKEYVSDFMPVIETPAIDSLTWKRQSDGVEIFVNSHNDQVGSRYYKWDYKETWEFHSLYKVQAKYKITPLEDYRNTLPYPNDANGDLVEIVPLDPENYLKEMYTCWKSRNSSSIYIGTTNNLEEDRIYVPVIFYKESSWELSVKYSVEVTQYSLSKEAYHFYQKMKKNSQNLGSLFDSQPSDITGNIRCTSDPSENVVGFVEVGSTSKKRIFISNSDLPGWNYTEACEEAAVSNTPIVHKCTFCECQTERYATQGYYYPIRTCAYLLDLVPYKVRTSDPFTGEIFSWNLLAKKCLDCRFRGDSQKPSFWP